MMKYLGGKINAGTSFNTQIQKFEKFEKNFFSTSTFFLD